MPTFLEILKFTLPSLIMLIGVYLIINKIFKQEGERRDFEMFRLNRDVVLPVRLRAYERLVLLLERTTPNSMLMRFDFSGFSVMQLQSMLLQTVRDEFEHNLSQQIYVSKDAWTLVCNARESVVQLINSVAAAMRPEQTALDYANALIATYSNSGDTPSEVAIEYIKKEVRLF